MNTRVLLLTQVIVVFGAIMLVGAFLMISGKHTFGGLIISGTGIINALLLERLSAALPRRPLIPKLLYRILAIVAALALVSALVQLVLVGPI